MSFAKGNHRVIFKNQPASNVVEIKIMIVPEYPPKIIKTIQDGEGDNINNPADAKNGFLEEQQNNHDAKEKEKKTPTQSNTNN
jgi:hypothetical protein